MKVLEGYTQYYNDPGGLIQREPRKRNARTFFTFTPKAKVNKKRTDPLGLEMLGRTFWDTEEGEMVQFTVTAMGDPTEFMGRGKRLVPVLKYKRSDDIEVPDAVEHTSKVTEVRAWMKSSENHVLAAQIGDDLGTENAEAVLCPLLLLPPVKLKVMKQGKESRPVKERVHEMLRACSVSRKTKRFKRADIIQLLKGKIRKRQFKNGVDIPLNYQDAHSSTRSANEIQAWTTEETEEMETLDQYFEKGIDINELQKTFPDIKPISGMWVYDTHPEGVKDTTHRARFVANGARDPEKGQHGSYSPVAQLATARVVLAMIKELKMDMVIADVSKAYWKGRYNREVVYMWAAEGFQRFEGEVWKVLAPINGLDDSGHTFYQTVSELMRSLGYKHHHNDPCFFRRLRGPGITHGYPEHTDCPVWRREAPNEDFNPHHVQMIDPAESNSLPCPNVLQTCDPKDLEQLAMNPMTDEEIQKHKLVDEDFLKAVDQLLHCKPGEEDRHYYELALWYVDDFLTGTYDKESILRDLKRRFGKITTHVNGGMFLGHDIEYDKMKGFIVLRLKTYMERVMESLLAKSASEIALNCNVGILNWATSCVFGTYQKEARILASNANLELQEDLETSLALIYEIYEKREQGLHFRDYGKGEHVFVPRTSRKEGIIDVSAQHRTRSTRPGAVVITKDDILQADDGYNVYQEDPHLRGFEEEVMPFTPLFHVTCWTDATYAPRGEDGRSDIFFVVMINGTPVSFNPITLSGVANSASSAEYCGASVGVLQTEIIRQTLRFAGAAVKVVGQYIDSTTAKQIAENPKKMGSARHLGIRWHLVRYHLHAKDLELRYSITEDCLADLGTKRLARKILDRFARIFFNCLSKNWRDDAENLEHICGDGVFMDGTKRESKIQVSFQDDDDDGAETEEEEDGDNGPGVPIEVAGHPNVPTGSYNLWVQGQLGDTLTTMAQHDWMDQYMKDNGEDWAPNAMRMLQYLALPEYADQHAQASVEEREALLKYYANQGHRVPPPPVDVTVLCRGQQVSLEGMRTFMQAAVNSGAAPFETMNVANAYESSSIQIENEYQEMSQAEGLPRESYPTPPPCWPPVYAGTGLGSRDDIAMGTEHIPHHMRRRKAWYFLGKRRL